MLAATKGRGFFLLSLKGERLNGNTYTFVLPFRGAQAHAEKYNAPVFIDRQGTEVFSTGSYRHSSLFAHGVRVVMDK